MTGFPEVLHHKRDVSKDEFLLMGSDGVWDVMSNQQAIACVKLCAIPLQALLSTFSTTNSTQR